MSQQTFNNPPAATRVKFRWWQPVADTNDAEIQQEVKAMAGNGGGGFEQNGFPVSMNCGGCSSQFLTFAASQQFLGQYGWGSPMWSNRVQTYESAAAQDGVIGDQNEGSRWNNTVPTVYSPNQPADAQDLSYGVQQYQPGSNPSGELPAVTAPALGGESTYLSVPASSGDRTIQVHSIAGLLAGDQVILGQGADAETATIKSVGTAAPEVPLSQPASAGSTVVHVAPASTATGVPGTAEPAAQFVPGEKVTIGSGAAAQSDTISKIGTYDVATAPTTLVLPPGGSGTVAAPAGATNVEVASTANFLKGDTITIGSGSGAQSATITSVGTAGSGTTLSAAANAGDLQVSVASATGLLAGQYITIGQGPAEDTDRIATISGDSLTLYTPLKSAHADGDAFAIRSIGVTFTPALRASHDVGEAAIDTGTGITLATRLTSAHASGETFLAPGTGVTLTAPLTRAHQAGANNAVATTLASAVGVGATNVKVASVSNLAAGDQLTIGQPGYTQNVTIQSVGTAGPSGTGISFTPALSQLHYSGDPAVDATNASVTNGSGGLSDIERQSLVAAELVQCLPPSAADSDTPATTTLPAGAAAGSTTITVASATGLAAGDKITIGTGSTAQTDSISSLSGTTVTLSSALTADHAAGEGAWDTCTTAAAGGTRDLDPASTVNVTSQVRSASLGSAPGVLNYTGGAALPAGNGQPWELIDFYLHGDTQTNAGGTATAPNQWLGHLSTTSAQAMENYFDDNILNDPVTQAAIKYEDTHTGTPAVFEDSLENSNNLNWLPTMISSWTSDLGYNPTSLLPALAATGRDATGTPAFDFPQADGQGATLGWRIRDDYGQLYNDLYLNNYVKSLDTWATSRGMVARFQSYGDPIDEGEASANEGIAETEHLETANNDETQQFKVAASGTYQDSSQHLLSDECCEASGQAWADPFGVDGTGNGPSPGATEPNAESVYADEAGGDSAIVYHGWPYTTGAAGSPALWPGSTYGGDTSFAAGNGPNQPQFADDKGNNINVARHNVVLRQGAPSFDVAVFHEDFGLTGQGQDNLTNGWNMGTVTSGGTTTRPTSGKLIRSSSSLAQAGYLYGYVSPAFFGYSDATFGVDSGDSSGGKVLFPGHGDYRSLVLYDQSVLPVSAANKIASLAAQGLPIVIIGQVPNASPNAAGGNLNGMQAADKQVQAAMAKVTAEPTTVVVADSTAANSQSSDANAPAALASLGIDPATQLNTPSVSASGTATPVLGIRRHAQNIDYYQLFNQSATTTVDSSVTLTGNGVPYELNTWSGTITPIANYTSSGGRVTMSLRIAPGNATDIAITPDNSILKAQPKNLVHAISTTANATQAGTGNVVYGSTGDLFARAGVTGSYSTALSNGQTVTSNITVPSISPSSTVSTIGGVATLTSWQLSVSSWTQTPSGDPTQTQHTAIPAAGTFTVSPLSGTTNGALPSWTAITPQNIPGLSSADNLTNVAGIGTYTTTFSLPSGWSAGTAGAYLNVGAAVDTVDIWVNGKAVTGVDENDRNQVDIGPYLRAGSNTLKISVATPLRNAVAVAPATPATGQVPNSAETIGSLQGGAKIANVGLIGPVTLTPYGQSSLGL